MMILSVKQPWADCLVAGIKPVENRSRRTSYRGWLAIHASNKRDGGEFARALAFPEMAKIQHIHEGPCSPLRPLHFATGKIIGVVELYECISAKDDLPIWETSSRWFSGPFGWLVRNAKILREPIAYVGHLSMRLASVELRANIEAQTGRLT